MKKMKNNLFKAGLFLIMLLTLGSCKKALDEKFTDPDKSTQANLPGLLTGILNNNRVKPMYWNVRTFLFLQPALYSQTAYFPISPAMYQQNDSYVGGYWTDFYTSGANGSGVMGMFRAMEVAYNAMSVSDQANQKVYLEAARVILYDQASQMIDLWGDIPYSEAGSLPVSSTIKNPKFDEQKALYDLIIAGLDASNTYFSKASANAGFSKADILLKGNIDLWRRYTNSIRLRMLMRISKVNESTAQTSILAMLNNPTQYPLIDGGNLANYSPATSDVLLQQLMDNNENLNAAFTEGSLYAPDYMLNTAMLPANDPRIPIMFDKYGKTVDGKFIPNPTYKAMPITYTDADQQAHAGEFAIMDSVTFAQNPKLPGAVMTASEVNFLKAEAYERWGSSATAQAAYELAVKQSVSFYYYLNGTNATGLKTTPKPDDATINTFATASTIAYTGSSSQKLALIYVQKWLHFGFLQSVQAWSEYRRTGFPQLTFPVARLSGFTTPPTRLTYPSVETSYNAANYQAVKSKDTRTTKIFWQP
jgi:hypothetical protein